jgi:hypothetical protein
MMNQARVEQFGLYCADVGNLLALSHRLCVRDLPVVWLKAKLIREFNLLVGVNLAAGHIAVEYRRCGGKP